jgi:hypothetical protein
MRSPLRKTCLPCAEIFQIPGTSRIPNTKDGLLLDFETFLHGKLSRGARPSPDTQWFHRPKATFFRTWPAKARAKTPESGCAPRDHAPYA